MKKLLFLSTIFLGTILIGLAAYSSTQAISYISDPASCAGCHAESYLNYSTNANGSIIPGHVNYSITCIACHSGKGTQGRVEALKTVAYAKLAKESKPFLNLLFKANISFNQSNITKYSNLQADCEKCHLDGDLKDEMHANNTACSLCHFAHTKEKINLQAVEVTKITHKNVKCTACHGTGTEMQIPACTKCHNPPHIKGDNLDNSICLSCHNDAHVPTRNITFSESIPKEFCSGCHMSEYQNLTTNDVKHNLLPSCVSCHPAHGSKKSCWDCHGGEVKGDKHLPHRSNNCWNDCHSYPSIIRTTGCATCHDPHNPFKGLPRPATDQQISEIARQRVQNLT